MDKVKKLIFYVKRDDVILLMRDERFIPRTRYIQVGEKFDDEIGVWAGSGDMGDDDVPIHLLPEGAE